MGDAVKIADVEKTMIQLSGFEVDKDIEIKFTGLPQDEKIFEEFIYDEKSIYHTPHPNLYVMNSHEYEWSYVNQQINTIIKNKHNYEKVKTIFNALVSESKNELGKKYSDLQSTHKF